MDNNKNDKYYITKILDDLKYIIKHTKKVSYEEFCGDELLQDAMMFRLIQISENANHLSDTIKTKYKKIPWKDVYGLRNRIVHDYGNVDLTIVYETIIKDIPKLHKEINSIK